MNEVTRTSQGHLSTQVYDVLKKRIVEGQMAPESQISEPALQEELNVSRTPLRRALNQLADEGLVTVYPQFGSFVAPISLEAAEQAQFVRQHLECGLIADVIAQIDNRGKDDLQLCIERQRRVWSNGDAALFYELDEQLHSLFATIAGRPGVGQMIRQQKAHLDRIRHLSLPMVEQIPRLIEQHADVVDAIMGNNVSVAEAALKLHLREIFKVIENLGLRSEAATKLPKRKSKRHQSTRQV
jgi:DNA-binding GntR family transcriptional regulator